MVEIEGSIYWINSQVSFVSTSKRSRLEAAFICSTSRFVSHVTTSWPRIQYSTHSVIYDCLLSGSNSALSTSSISRLVAEDFLLRTSSSVLFVCTLLCSPSSPLSTLRVPRTPPSTLSCPPVPSNTTPRAPARPLARYSWLLYKYSRRSGPDMAGYSGRQNPE